MQRRDAVNDAAKKQEKGEKKFTKKQLQKINFIDQGLVDALEELDIAKPKKNKNQLEYRYNRAELILRAGEMRAAVFE